MVPKHFNLLFAFGKVFATAKHDNPANDSVFFQGTHTARQSLISDNEEPDQRLSIFNQVCKLGRALDALYCPFSLRYATK